MRLMRVSTVLFKMGLDDISTSNDRFVGHMAFSITDLVYTFKVKYFLTTDKTVVQVYEMMKHELNLLSIFNMLLQLKFRVDPVWILHRVL